jgi:hypothetical protein
MITSLKQSITGYGILFFGGLLEGRFHYEISVREERVSGHFDGRVTVPKHYHRATMLLENCRRIKLQIVGDPESKPLRFDVIDDESIAICRDLT